MKALRDLRRFILCKSAEGAHAEVRAYVTENLDTLARAFHVPVETLMNAVEGERDGGSVCTKLLETLRQSEAILRHDRRERRMRAAQASAEALASAVVWRGERAYVDMPSLLASALTRRDDMLAFAFDDDTTVAVYQSPLLDLAKIARVRDDLSGWVDRDGLHLRWGRAGGLNLRPQEDADARKVMLCLTAKAAARAA
jgi:hypothetical protein